MPSDKRHMTIWKQVEETQPGYTKTADLDGRQVTTINGTYMAKRATEVFGPVGIGWGYEVEDEQFQPGSPIHKDGEYLGTDIMHTLRLRLWFKDPESGEYGSVVHYGHTPYIRGTYYGAKTDFDAPKKSMTDAVKKCLSMLGFSADVFLGLYDDSSYVEAARVNEQVQQADEHDEKVIEKREEFWNWLESEIATYPQVPHARSLKLMRDGHVRKAQRQCQVLGIDSEKVVEKIDKAFRARYDELVPDQPVVCASCGTADTGKPGQRCPACGQGKLQPTDNQTNGEQSNDGSE